MVQININLDGAKRKLSQQSVQRGQYALGNQAMADMNRFVPKKDNILRETAHFDGDNIIYNQPYAGRMFYMYMYNYTTPGTGPRWDNKASAIHMKDWMNAFIKGAQW
ncbi:minor capsid protein [Oceanobacillus oncorhynchi]|uniref:minor capsid protein n=1 Tax=Oceanobacillus oncorhynchi TaxID=545501 RepID=UPI001865AE3C|nr:minor capsid protein [Oceanobacillus oncorhynchi]